MKSTIYKWLVLKIYFLFLISDVIAQSQQPIYNKYLGKTIKSTVEYRTKPKVISTGPNGVSESIESSNYSKIDKQTWFAVMSNTKGQLNMTRELNRLEVTAPGPSGIEKYDSANTFESTDGAEAFVTSKLKALKKKVTYKLKENEWETEGVLTKDVDKVWTDNIPIMGQGGPVQGLFFNASLPKDIANKGSWKETIVRPDSEVENTYTIEGIEKNLITINLVSQQKFNDKNKLNLFNYGNVKGSPNQPMPNKMGSIDISKKYEGTIVIDQSTLLISKMEFTVSSKKNLINGNVNTPRIQTLALQITNQL